MHKKIKINLVIICDEDDVFCDEHSFNKGNVKGVLDTVRRMTDNGTVIVGRKTYENVYDSYIAGKTQIIFTSKNKSKPTSSVYVPQTDGISMTVYSDSWDKTYAFARRLSWNAATQNRREVYIIGGFSLFKDVLNNYDDIDTIKLIQFYSSFSHLRGFNSHLCDIDRSWKTVDVKFGDMYDIITMTKRDKYLTDFDDPCEV